MSFGVASSKDMVTWEVESYNIIPQMHDPKTRWPVAKYAWFMPTIAHNPKTGRYALWYYIDDYARGVAVATSPVGPFKIVTFEPLVYLRMYFACITIERSFAWNKTRNISHPTRTTNGTT